MAGMDNPYQAPEEASSRSDEIDYSRRPLGVSILSALAGMMGLGLAGLFVFFLIHWEENNERFLQQACRRRSFGETPD